MIGSRSAGALQARALSRQLHSIAVRGSGGRPSAQQAQHPLQRARPHPGRLPGAGRGSQSAATGSSVMAPTDGGRQPSIRGELVELFRAAIDATFPDAGEAPIVTPTNNPKFGDYQCNNAMPLHGKLKGKEGAPKAPRDVATKILGALPANDLVGETSLAGPGFINVKLRPDYLAARVLAMLRSGSLACWAPKLSANRVLVDFSAPNVAKEMHVGHLRSTIIGDTIARTLEYCGCDVLRINHIGDWGTQFGMLIQYMAEEPGGLEEASNKPVSDLMVLYRAAKTRFDSDEPFKTASREAVTRLQGGEPTYMAAWERICDASRREFEAIYTRLGVELTERGESFYNPMLADTVAELKQLGVATESDGATVVFTEGNEVPLIVQKSGGGYGYDSTDMAAIRQRVRDERIDWGVYVTDVGQAQHFQLIFAAARAAGYLPKDAAQAPRVTHVGFGLVMGEDGKKFKTRSGDVVRLVELLDEAKARCKANIGERRAEAGDAYDEAELDATAAIMGYGAVKYADLKNHRMTNYKFNYDQMLDLRGNTAVYLQYAHARIAGIGRKSGRDVAALAAGGGAAITLAHPKEVELALHMCRFPEAVEDMLEELIPNRVCEYLYTLSEAFSAFYTECKVIGTPEEDSRLMLCEATGLVMRQCFYLLGITPLYKI